MNFHSVYDTPSDLDYSSWENFECPYDHQCDGCEYDCGDDL